MLETTANSGQEIVCNKGGRLSLQGKFLHIDGARFFLNGVTYGPFRPNVDGSEYHEPEVVHRDFAQMKVHGINCVRTYTIPPRWFLDAASDQGLMVMVGLPWEQHVAFLGERRQANAIRSRLRQLVQSCADHPAVAAYTVGNEIPAPIVRWHGRYAVEAFLHQLCKDVKSEDPEALVTYVNYPTTEYLRLPFIDFMCFNVYLEAQETLDAYLARLQTIAADKPLVMAEIGLDSQRNGEDMQAETLAWQIKTCFSAGCAGTFVFAWTDEWHRGGYDIEDWDFGLTRRDRSSKPALTTVAKAYRETPVEIEGRSWPLVSVLICSYNGAHTIEETCTHVKRLEYPNFEVIVVDDGSRDHTGDVAHTFGFQVIQTENRGLSSARNTALQAASGEIVAYVDDDAYPDQLWLTYLVEMFQKSDFAAIGGPNLPPAGDGLIAECVAKAPGGPIHVLVTDREAEHIPGCNMAFRREVLLEIGGFDPQFRIAGDDVDICWRLQDAGHRIGFHPTAQIWHHRRNSMKTYWQQQQNYGRAEALLEAKYPARYNSFGQPSWQGRIYGDGVARSLVFRRHRIYHGVWGTRAFQGIYTLPEHAWAAIMLMPEWFLVIAGLAILTVLGLTWPPLLIAAPFLLLAIFGTVIQAVLSAADVRFATPCPTVSCRVQRFTLITSLYSLQPLARLTGRLQSGLTPWRWRGVRGYRPPWPTSRIVWDEQWQSPEQRLETMERLVRTSGAISERGGEFDRWDLQVRGGLFGGARLCMVIEEHGGGRQLVRFAIRPVAARVVLLMILLFGALTILATLDGAMSAGIVLGLALLVLLVRLAADCGIGIAAFTSVIDEMERAIHKKLARSDATSRTRSAKRSPVQSHDNQPIAGNIGD